MVKKPHQPPKKPQPARKPKAEASGGLPMPPEHLGAVESALWAALNREHVFDDAASLALLRVSLEAHQRSRECRESIAIHGQMLTDKFGQQKINPLIAAERDARAAFMQGLKLLKLESFA